MNGSHHCQGHSTGLGSLGTSLGVTGLAMPFALQVFFFFWSKTKVQIPLQSGNQFLLQCFPWECPRLSHSVTHHRSCPTKGLVTHPWPIPAWNIYKHLLQSRIIPRGEVSQCLGSFRTGQKTTRAHTQSQARADTHLSHLPPHKVMPTADRAALVRK